MRARLFKLLLTLLIVLASAPAFADDYSSAIRMFRNAGVSGKFFADSYGYAVFPAIGKGGMVLGAAYGRGRVYREGKYVGDATMTQITVGAQLGGQVYSEIVFFRNKAAFDKFTKGEFEFGAQAAAVAMTAGALAHAGTSGASAGASGTPEAARTAGRYYKGIAVFTIEKGGLMYEASLGGEKFSYSPLG